MQTTPPAASDDYWRSYPGWSSAQTVARLQTDWPTECPHIPSLVSTKVNLEDEVEIDETSSKGPLFLEGAPAGWWGESTLANRAVVLQWKREQGTGETSSVSNRGRTTILEPVTPATWLIKSAVKPSNSYKTLRTEC